MIRQRPPTPAPNSCVPCRQGKRKCDRRLPECALCRRIGRKCRYPTPTPKVTPLPPPPPIFDMEQYSTTSIHQNLRDQLLSIIGDDLKVYSVMNEYFNTIQTWFPVLDEGRVKSDIPRIFEGGSGRNLKCALRAACILLVVTVPERDGDGKGGGEGLSKWLRVVYVVVKGAMGLLEGCESGSESGEGEVLVMLQVRLLIAVFEVGHGMNEAAYVTLGGMARSLVVFREGAKMNEREREEVDLLWRGLIVIDRYLSLDLGNNPCLTKGLAGKADHKQYLSSNSATFNNKIANDFNQLSNAVDLLDKVSRHVHDPTPYQDFNWEEALQLMKALISFSAILKEQDVDPNGGAVAVLNSAMMNLSDFGNRSGYEVAGNPGIECERGSLVFLEGLVQEVVQMAGRITEADILVISPLIAYSMKKAILILENNLRGIEHIDQEGNVAILESGLDVLGRRWGCAGRYLDLLKRGLP